jgi:DNA-binding transcriptional regulator GbsR (MarR family)
LDSQTARFVKQVGRFFEQEGYAPIMGQVFGRLLLAPEPMALVELVRDLGVSKASISTDTRRLERQKIVERIRRPRDRRAYYRVATDLPVQIMALRIDRIGRFRNLLTEAETRLRQGAPSEVRQRLSTLDRAHSHMLAAMTAMLSDWRAGTESTTRSGSGS